ncbi:MAG: toll/interleukin-1 receptor domain-containing protein [Clostridia bacterium]|nr:MAG: toll/interleukin-1 receptor domain-containing protein [Clostridia bacterium]
MDFIKLPSNSKQILDEILASENPAAMLQKRFEGVSPKEDAELRGILRELRESGYIDIKWADNIPYVVVINNSARTYEEQLINYETVGDGTIMDTSPMQTIFISHRTTDRAIADILLDFFIATGIPREKVFCSSLPGNDVRERISVEVKEALQNSCLNIAILSDDYYKSAYCLNEAGILWYENVPVIPVALPEINHENMIGFLNDDYKIRRLDNMDDLAYIYDTACEESASSQSKASIVTAESHKLIEKYQLLISTRPQVQIAENPKTFDVTTDDERIVLYYLISKQVRKVSKAEMLKWIQDKEISEVNVDNAFDLLSTIGTGKFENDTLELGIEAFRKLTATPNNLIDELKVVICAHTALSSDRFNKLWEENGIDNDTKLFIAYIIDERIDRFGNRWMAEGQTENIKIWEEKYSLDSTLSSSYGKCLSFFIQNNFVFESDWTSYGNPREYRLCTSLKELLFNHSDYFSDQLQSIKDLHHYDLPF